MTENCHAAEPGFKTWNTPQCPFAIEVAAEVLEGIRQETDDARTSSKGERETGGVLFGIHAARGIRILFHQPLRCEYAMGPGFVLSEKDERRLADLVASAGKGELESLEALGWYHSHIRSRIYLSERDLQVHARHFPAPHQIALVAHPEGDAPLRAGFFFREASGTIKADSSYEEFSIEPPAPAEAPAAPAVEPARARTHRRAAKDKPVQPPPRAICPRCSSVHLRRSRRAGPLENLRALFGYYPYRCHECLSRPFLKTAPDVISRARQGGRKRPEERHRARMRTRREILLWGGGIMGFLAVLYYVVRDTGPKQEQP